MLYLTERREQVGRQEAKQLLEYKVTRGGPERLKEIQERIETLLGVSVDAFESDRTSAGDRVAEMDVDEFLLEVNGSGVKEALRLILDLELKRPSLLLVEEPEVHLHPALEINMMEYLRDASTRCQIFLTTHSTNFLDLSRTQGVYFVTKPEGATIVKRLNRGEAESQVPKELGIRLSSLFMFDRLVFVEGLSDELILREFASILKLNLSEANVGFVHLGGSRNFAHYANEAILAFLSKRQVKSTFVIDRDERDETELSRMKASLGDRAVLHVLKRRELENYMIARGPVSRYLSQKMALAGAIPTQPINETNVANAMAKAAEELRVFSYLKKASRSLLSSLHVALEIELDAKMEDAESMFLDEIKRLQEELSAQEARVPGVLSETKKMLDTQYGQNWTALVCGDILLDEVFKKFGSRFKKVSDGPKLAAEFRSSEVEAELTQLLQSFVAKD